MSDDATKAKATLSQTKQQQGTEFWRRTIEAGQVQRQAGGQTQEARAERTAKHRPPQP